MTIENDVITIILPYPPSANQNWRAVAGGWRTAKNGTRYRKYAQSSVEVKQYHITVLKTVLLQGIKEIQGVLRVLMTVHPPLGKKRYDVDNYNKVVLDSLQKAGIYRNDYLITDLQTRILPRCEQPCVIIRIESIGDEAKM